jgi:hypothetical protein
MVRKMMMQRRYPLLIAVIGLCLVAWAWAATGNIDPTDKWAWGTNVGWINFADDNGGVTVYSDHLEGYAWGENIGWIRLGTHDGGSPHTYLNTTKDNYGVNNDGAGHLSGYAWGTNVGWINFAPTDGGVTINTSSGEFDGYAWGENIGWIHFKGTAADMTEYSVVTSYYPTVANQAPLADAGPDQTVTTNATVTLDGSGSSDPDGDLPLAYRWTQVDGPAVSFTPDVSITTFTAPADPAVLTFTLAVTDSLGLPDPTPDEVVVTISTENLPPVADAGLDQSAAPGATVTLDASGSADPDGNLPLAYGWTQTDGPPVTLDDRTAVSPSFVAPDQASVLTFSLVVTDALGLASAPDSVVIVVSQHRVFLPLVVRNEP